MRVSELIWDINEIKGALEDDSDLEEMWLIHKINSYRAIGIQEEFALSNQINPIWLQRVPKFSLTKCTAADDPSITYSSIVLSKATLPKVVSLPDDLGTYRISGSGAIMQFEPVDFNTLMMKIEMEEERDRGYGYYAKVGGTIYLHPITMEGSAIIIAENPFDIQINDLGTLRDMTFEDDYPLDIAIAQKVILQILTKDLLMNDQAITDIVNDSQKQLKIMKDASKQ
jgi:hypothetical protein